MRVKFRRIGRSDFPERLSLRQQAGLYGHTANERPSSPHGVPAPEETINDGTSRPRIFSASARLALPFSLAGQRFRYNADWRAQWDETALVPLDRFSIGDRYTVRGFDGENTLMADRGWLARNDLS